MLEVYIANAASSQLVEKCSLICTADASPDALRELRDACIAILTPLVKGYIWQREAFTLHSSTDQHPPWKLDNQPRANGHRHSNLGTFASRVSSFLWGSTRFDDNVEDEWFITWLLFEITR